MKNLKLVSRKNLESELINSRSTQRLRSHILLHESHQELVQKLFICMNENSYIRPHRHPLNAPSELLVAIKGSFVVHLFDDSGNVRENYILSSDFSDDKGEFISVEIPTGVWHTVTCDSESGVLLEVKEGPFNENIAKEFMPGTPDELDEISAFKYVDSLKEQRK